MEKLSEKKDEEIEKEMKELAKSLGKDIAPSQVRKLFSEVKTLSWKVKKEKVDIGRRMLRLKPRLAYAVARKKELRELYNVFGEYISKTKDEKDLDKLVFALESFIAYQKYFEKGSGE